MLTRKLPFIIGLTVFAGGCNGPQSGYVVENNLDIPLADKAVVLTYEEVNEYLPEDVGDNYVVVVDEKGERLPTQCDDLDGDGNWDEMAFLVSLKAGESKTLYFNTVTRDQMPEFPKRTNIRFGYKEPPYEEVTNEERLKSTDSPTISAVFQMEGPAWENDLVGFRNYYDARNGIDIYGKKTTEMVLDSAGIRGQDYHSMDSWGMDILKVGNSLGAGAIGICVGDEVSRVGECERGTYNFITEGPVRAMFELKYEGVPVSGRRYDVTHRISIYAGDLFYRSKVFVDGLRGDEELVTGIVNMEQKESFDLEESGYKIVASHGNQAYLGENLGMAVLIPDNQFIETWKSSDEGDGIVETHMIALSLNKENPSEYCFFSGWEYQDEGFKTRDYFENQLIIAAKKMSDFNSGK
jgi:hypothetical protein